jgi:hypothetical protein
MDGLLFFSAKKPPMFKIQILPRLKTSRYQDEKYDTQALFHNAIFLNQTHHFPVMSKLTLLVVEKCCDL